MEAVEAGEFRLVDGEGNVRAILGLVEDNGIAERVTFLKMNDGSGNSTATVRVDDIGASVRLKGVGAETLVNANINGADVLITRGDKTFYRIFLQNSNNKMEVEVRNHDNQVIFKVP